MPLEISVNPNYTRIVKIPIDNTKRLPDSKNAFDYVVELPFSQELQRVFAIELAGYNFRYNFTPSFYPGYPSIYLPGLN